MSYSVSFSKKVDSLPGLVDIEYRYGTRDPSDTHTEQINANWNQSHTCLLNEKVTLKAVSVSNIKSIIVIIEANGSNRTSDCYIQGCTAYVEQTLGNR